MIKASEFLYAIDDAETWVIYSVYQWKEDSVDDYAFIYRSTHQESIIGFLEKHNIDCEIDSVKIRRKENMIYIDIYLGARVHKPYDENYD